MRGRSGEQANLREGGGRPLDSSLTEAFLQLLFFQKNKQTK